MPNLSSEKHNDLSTEVVEEARNKLRAFQKETAYFLTRRDDPLRDYPEEWVAILDQKIIGINADRAALVTNLRSEGRPMRDVYIECVTDEDPDTFRVPIQ